MKDIFLVSKNQELTKEEIDSDKVLNDSTLVHQNKNLPKKEEILEIVENSSIYGNEIFKMGKYTVYGNQESFKNDVNFNEVNDSMIVHQNKDLPKKEEIMEEMKEIENNLNLDDQDKNFFKMEKDTEEAKSDSILVYKNNSLFMCGICHTG